MSTIRDGTTFECADCDRQTSLTSGTVLEKTRKPLKMCVELQPDWTPLCFATP